MSNMFKTVFVVGWIVLFITPQTQLQNVGPRPERPTLEHIRVSSKTLRHTSTSDVKLRSSVPAPAVRHAPQTEIHRKPSASFAAAHPSPANSRHGNSPAVLRTPTAAVRRNAPAESTNTSLTHGSIRDNKRLVDTRTTTTTSNPKNDVETIRPIIPPQPPGQQPPPGYPPPLPDYPPYPYEPPYFINPDDLPYHPNEPPSYNPFPPQHPPPYYPALPPVTQPPYEPATPATTPEDVEVTTRYTEPTTRYTEPTTPRNRKSTLRKVKLTTSRPKSAYPGVTKPFTTKFTKHSTYYVTPTPPAKVTKRSTYFPYTPSIGYPYEPPVYAASPATTPRRLYYPLTTRRPPVPPAIWPHLTSTVRPAAVVIPRNQVSLPYSQGRSNAAAPAAPAVWTPTPHSVEVIGTPSELDPKYKLAVVSNYQNYNESSGTFSFDIDLENGVTVNVRGYMKDGKQVLDGSFTLFTNEGEPVRISYVADDDSGGGSSSSSSSSSSSGSPVVKGGAVSTNTSNSEVEDFTSTPDAMPMSTEVWNN